MSGPWEVLSIEPTGDLRAIKRAYAAQAAKLHPEEHPEEFRRLREAYEAAADRAGRLSGRAPFSGREPAGDGSEAALEAKANPEEETAPEEERLIFPEEALNRGRQRDGKEGPAEAAAPEEEENRYSFEAVERRRLRYAEVDFDGVLSFLGANVFSPETTRDAWRAFFEDPCHRGAFQSRGFCDSVEELLRQGELVQTAWQELLLLCPQAQCRERGELPCRNLRRYLTGQRYFPWQVDLSQAAMKQARACYVGCVGEWARRDWKEFAGSESFLCAYSLPVFMAELTVYLSRTRELSGECRRMILGRYRELEYAPERREQEVYLRLTEELACYDGGSGGTGERLKILKARLLRGALKALWAFYAAGQWVFAAAMVWYFLLDADRMAASGEVLDAAFSALIFAGLLIILFAIRRRLKKEIGSWTEKKQKGMAAALSAAWVILLRAAITSISALDYGKWIVYFILAVPPLFMVRIIRRSLKR